MADVNRRKFLKVASAGGAAAAATAVASPAIAQSAPELKWRLSPDSVLELVIKQRDLLASAVSLVAPGGALLYTTCSIEPEENEEVVRNLPSGFEIENLEPHLPAGVPSIPTPAGGIRILPNPDGDGFTMHALRRAG